MPQDQGAEEAVQGEVEGGGQGRGRGDQRKVAEGGREDGCNQGNGLGGIGAAHERNGGWDIVGEIQEATEGRWGLEQPSRVI